jgi:hypothetical protein
MASVSHLAPTHLGLDVHKDTLSVAILAPDRDGPDLDRIPHDEASVPRLVGHLGDPPPVASLLRGRPDQLGAGSAAASHARALRGDRAVADLLGPGDKVQTDRRDCRRLVRGTGPGS